MWLGTGMDLQPRALQQVLSVWRITLEEIVCFVIVCFVIVEMVLLGWGWGLHNQGRCCALFLGVLGIFLGFLSKSKRWQQPLTPQGTHKHSHSQGV